jgi:rRNA maturation endonuclease Nob1
MTCLKCGKEFLGDEDSFCPACGSEEVALTDSDEDADDAA